MKVNFRCSMIIGGFGNMRAGKTLGITALGVFLGTLTKQTIYANYHLNIENYVYFQKWNELKNVRNSVILFDEIHTAMDSRNTKSSDQIYFTHLFSQMGKFGNTLLYTSQRFNAVEKRIRENTDFFFWATRHWPGSKLSQTWWDARESTETPKKLNTYILRPEPLYGLYNTYEKVESTVVIEKGSKR